MVIGEYLKIMTLGGVTSVSNKHPFEKGYGGTAPQTNFLTVYALFSKTATH